MPCHLYRILGGGTDAEPLTVALGKGSLCAINGGF